MVFELVYMPCDGGGCQKWVSEEKNTLKKNTQRRRRRQKGRKQARWFSLPESDWIRPRPKRVKSRLEENWSADETGLPYVFSVVKARIESSARERKKRISKPEGGCPVLFFLRPNPNPNPFVSQFKAPPAVETLLPPLSWLIF